MIGLHMGQPGEKMTRTTFVQPDAAQAARAGVQQLPHSGPAQSRHHLA